MGSAVTCPEDRPDAQIHSAVLDTQQFVRKGCRFVSNVPAVERGNEIHKIDVESDQMAVTRKSKGFVDVRGDHQLWRWHDRRGGIDPGYRYEKQDCDDSKPDCATHRVLRCDCSSAPRTTSIHRGSPPCTTHCQHTFMISRKPYL